MSSILRTSAALLALLTAALPVHPQATPQARVTEGHQTTAPELQALGQLAATHEPGCIPLDKVKPIYTAADLYRSGRQCLDKDAYDLAAPLFNLAGGYGRYDIKRIADQTVGGGLTILIRNFGDGLTDAQKQGFLAATRLLHDDTQKHKWFCGEVKRIGPPQYIPVYLIVHGMGPRGGEVADANGLDPKFDGAVYWSLLMTQGMLCQ